MTLLSVKSTDQAYVRVKLGTEMLNFVCSFYYVKLFLQLYQVSEVFFYQALMILIIWNVLNDMVGYFHINFKVDCYVGRRLSVLYGGPIYAAAFLLLWFPWKYYEEDDCLSGLQMMVSLCVFESALTCVRQAQLKLFAETFPRPESQLQLIKLNQVASLLGSTSILFCGLISDNLEVLTNFQAIAVILAFLAAASLYTGMHYMKHFDPKRSSEESLLLEGEQELSETSVILFMSQILSQKNLYLFLTMSFFHVFNLAFFNNFTIIFADHLIPENVLSSSVKSIMYGVGFICSQCLVLICQSLLKKFGYYKIILISFYLEATASTVMLVLGQEYYYCLALYITSMMVIIQATFCLFILPLTDMVDADLLKYNRKSPLFSMVFGINALCTKPAQFLAPMMVLSTLSQYGYKTRDQSIPLAVEDAMFSLICLIPLGIAVFQILLWTPFSTRNKTGHMGIF